MGRMSGLFSRPIGCSMQSWFEGNYAYWNAAAIAENYDLETMQNVIALFVAENLGGEEAA